MIDCALNAKNAGAKLKLTVKSIVSLGVVALAVILPQILHAVLGAAGGVKWLPMYLPVMIGGCLLGASWGAAAALLYAYMGVAELCAHVMSERAAQVCELHGIAYRCDMIVPHIINRKGDGVCPMEHAVAQTDDPRAAVSIIADKLKAMSAT